MKKNFLAIFTIFALTLVGCASKEKKESHLENIGQKDSVDMLLAQKDNEINDMMSVMNEIQEGFREINEAENRVNIVNGDGEDTSEVKQIKDNIKFIVNKMTLNRDLIAKLQKKLENSSIKGEALRVTINNLLKQLDEKDQQLQRFREQLNEKDIHIAELDETINNLNTNVSTLSEDNQNNIQTINLQDKQLNTAWYAFGNKKELKEQGILISGKLLQGNFNKNYFTKIDIRDLHEIKFYSKMAKMLTIHPVSSYTLYRDNNKQYVLRITNPQNFWSTSKYLVVLVK